MRRALSTLKPQRGSLARTFLGGMGVNGIALALNLVSGILVARSLAPEGRGMLAAILIAPNLAPYLFSMGCQKAASFHIARNADDAGRIIVAWSAILVPVSLASIVVLEALVPVLLHAQSAHTQHLARLWVLTAIIALYSQLTSGVLLGAHEFRAYYLANFSQPVVLAAGYVGLWTSGRLTLGAALLVNALAGLTAVAIGGARAIGRCGLALPGRSLVRSTLWYGVRAHGGDLGSTVNARLDALIIPSLLGAAQVGYYSVAANASWMIFAVTASISAVVLPAAARRSSDATATVVSSLRITLVAGAVMAGLLAVAAPFLVPLIYGSAFDPSVVPLEILIAGTVLYSAAAVLVSGLNALDRPWQASAVQIIGAIMTLGFLSAVLLSGMGIVGAACVSSAVYGVVFILALVLYKNAAAIEWHTLVRSAKYRRRSQRWGFGQPRFSHTAFAALTCASYVAAGLIVAVVVAPKVGQLGTNSLLAVMALGGLCAIVLPAIIRSRELLLFVVVALLSFSYVPYEVYPHSLNLNLPLFALVLVVGARYGVLYLRLDKLESAVVLLGLAILGRLAFTLPGSTIGISRELSKLCAAIVLYRIARKLHSFSAIYRGITTALVIIVAIGIYQIHEGAARLTSIGYIAPTFNFSTAAGTMRPFATFRSPVDFGIYIAMLLAFLVWANLGRDRGAGRLLVWGAVAFGLGGLAMTYTRSAWIALALSTIVIYAAQPWRERRRFLRPALTFSSLAVVALAAKPVVATGLVTRLQSLLNSDFASNSDRRDLWLGTIRAVAHDPLRFLFGYGDSDFVKALTPYTSPDVAALGHAHNVYLEVMFKYGTLGLALFILVLARLWVSMRRTFATAFESHAAASASLAALLVFLIGGLFENLWTSFNLIASLFLLVGVGHAARETAQVGVIENPLKPRNFRSVPTPVELSR